MADAVARLRRAVRPLIAIVALVALFVVAFPTRIWLAQREAIAAEQERVEVLSEQNERLAARVSQLQSDAEIERLAREQYNLVRPGEEAYAILPAPEADPAPPPPPPPPEEPKGLWSRIWERITGLF